MDDVRPAMAACFGTGGAFGVGFNMGVAAGLLDEGIDCRRGPMIGTSAGGYTACALAAGITFEQIADLWTRYTESRRGWWLRCADLTEQIFNGTSGIDVATVVLNGRWRRQLLSA